MIANEYQKATLLPSGRPADRSRVEIVRLAHERQIPLDEMGRHFARLQFMAEARPPFDLSPRASLRRGGPAGPFRFATEAEFERAHEDWIERQSAAWVKRWKDVAKKQRAGRQKTLRLV
jgi:hypothetical protein